MIRNLTVVLIPLVLATTCLVTAAEGPPSLDSVRKRLDSGEPTRIVCFGDSITGAYYHTGGVRAWTDMLGIAIQRTYPQARLEMTNAGISGHTTAQGLARMEKDVLAKEPHLVVVMFGMNDVARLPLDEYVANLKTIIEKCHAAGAAVLLCTPNSVYENASRPNGKLAELAERVKLLAKEQKLPVADCFADYRDFRAKDETAWMLVMSDEIHPNMNGHRRFAELIAETISGRRLNLADVPPPADALHHTLARLAAGEEVHLIAAKPYDQLMTAALRERFPEAKIRTTVWPTEGKTLHEMSEWAKGIRDLKPDLVVPAVPAAVTATDAGAYIRDYEWVLNWSYPFAGRAWDVVPVLPSLTGPVDVTQKSNEKLARQIVLGKDCRFLERTPGDKRPVAAILSSWIAEQNETRLAAWPELPAANATVSIPAQEWPRRPGPRQVKVLVHYPGGRLENVNEKSGLMLSLHNWGGENCVGTADPRALADRLNVVALCVNYLQSGPEHTHSDPEPYEFGYLQALDALHSLWWAKAGLKAKDRPFAEGRIYATGGSGGGNVTLMANKLAPRTFACVVDLCGMKKLSHDMAFNLPGGSELNARWSRSPTSPNYLSFDEQDLRFVGHPRHLATMKELGTTCRVVVVHGVDDTTCPFADAREMVTNMQALGLAVEPRFITKADLDGKVFTSSGHAMGNRTDIVFKVAGDRLAADGPRTLARLGPTDFDRRDELVRYRTPGGQFVISYAAGFPIGRFEPDPPAVSYAEHTDLGYYLDDEGAKREVRTPGDWQIHRRHILDNLQRVMGLLPGESQRVPLDVQVLEEKREGEILRRKISFQSDPFDRVTAWLLIPASARKDEKRPAMLVLHQTSREGKNEPIGLSGRPSMHVGKELAERGYVVLAPDYPSFGEHAYDFTKHPEFASGSLKAVWDNIRCVDLLETLPEVDARRIGVIGHSLGGHNAIFTALFEPRLKVVVSSCGFTSLLKDDLPSWTGPTYMPRIASEFKHDIRQLPFDFHELIAGLAPRPFFACAATRDDDFDVSGVRDVMAAAQPIYRLLGQPDALQADYPDSPHDFPKESRELAYKFLERHFEYKK